MYLFITVPVLEHIRKWASKAGSSYFAQIKKGIARLKSEMFTRPNILVHSMARANLNKSEKMVVYTTAASKYIPKRSRICINWKFSNIKNAFEKFIVISSSEREDFK